MKRKPTASDPAPQQEIVIAPAEVVTSNIYYAQDKVNSVMPCAVCGSDSTEADSEERLCWVCRRLKISAWRDSEPMPAQE